MIGLVTAVVIGAGSALLTLWIFGKSLSCRAGIVLVSAPCLAYHAVALVLAWLREPVFLPKASLVMPLGFGICCGNDAFALALAIQVTVAAASGIGLYCVLKRSKKREE